MTALADALAPIKERIPPEAKDLRLNLDGVLSQTSLDLDEALGCALAAAILARSPEFVAVFTEADELPADQVAGATTAASLMAMTTTWYPYLDLADDPELSGLPARLRMQAYATHGGVGEERFELYALAASIVASCRHCVSAHYANLRKAGRSAEHLRDVGRVAAVVAAIATILAAEI